MEQNKLYYQTDKVIQGLYKNIEKYLTFQNEIWHGILKLIITLASSMLVLSVAFIEKFVVDICIFIILSWLFFFLTIIFGVVALISEVISFSNFTAKQAIAIKEYEIRLANGEVHISDLDIKIIYPNDIKWGVATLNVFFLAVTCVFESLLYKHTGDAIWITGASIFPLFLILLNYHLLKKYLIGIKILNDKEKIRGQEPC